MPLSRAREEVLSTMNGVKFLMRDRRMEVPCRATLDLLADRFDSNGTPSGQEQAFLLHRGAIEYAASVKFDEGDIEPHDDPKIVVTARDMASPLSRKF
jgi:hypothetical protein